MKKDDVGFWEFFTSLLRNTNIIVLVKRCTYQPYLVAIYHFCQLLTRPQQIIRVSLAPLESNLDSAVILKKFDLVLPWNTVLFNLLEQVLTVQPYHFNRVELYSHFSKFLIRHTNYYLIVKPQLSNHNPQFKTSSLSKSFPRTLLCTLFASALEHLSSLSIMFTTWTLNSLCIGFSRLFQSFIAFQVLQPFLQILFALLTNFSILWFA